MISSSLNVVLVGLFMHYVCFTNIDLYHLKGAMTFGEAGHDGVRVHDAKEIETFFDILQAHGHSEVISTYLSK